MRVLTKDSANNKLSFVKDSGWVVDSFDISFAKTVGDTTLSLVGLQDELSLADCTPFIILPIDLLANSIPSGEYVVDLTYNSEVQESLLVQVEEAEPSPVGGDTIYGSVIVL